MMVLMVGVSYTPRDGSDGGCRWVCLTRPGMVLMVGISKTPRDDSDGGCV